MEQEKNYTLHQVIEQTFDFDGYSEEEKKNLIDESAGMIFEAALLRSLDDAGEASQDSFSAFAESDPDEEAMSQFIANNLPNFQTILLDEIKVFQQIGEEETTA